MPVRASALADRARRPGTHSARTLLANALPVEPPLLRPEPARRVRPWRVDESAVALAGKSLRLKYPVKVRITTTRRLTGQYRWVKGTRRHHLITIGTWLDQEAAGRAAWSALARALERERRLGPRLSPADLDARAQEFELRNRRLALVVAR